MKTPATDYFKLAAFNNSRRLLGAAALPVAAGGAGYLAMQRPEVQQMLAESPLAMGAGEAVESAGGLGPLLQQGAQEAIDPSMLGDVARLGIG